MATYNMRILHINDQDLVYSAPPFCHIALLISVLGPFCAGAGILILNCFNAEKSLEIMSRYKATHVIGVPTMYIYMLKNFDSSKYNLAYLRLAFCAGGPMPIQYIEEIEEKWNEFIKFLLNRGEAFSQFFLSVDSIKLNGATLVFKITGSFYRQWIMETQNKDRIEMIIKRYVKVPEKFSIDVDALEDIDKMDKILRRYDDLTK
jgi:acyl-CoA synthetase (AMP-forming)/AMP-acid ligase II